jgi:tRNA-modifying protein YgfZ
MSYVTDSFDSQYKALTQGVGLVEFSTRTQIEFRGADRAKFLHNLCTNAVRDLSIGKGCETFVLNVKGHIVGHGFLFVCPDSIVLETVPGQAEGLLVHFNRYLIREDVQLIDRSQSWTELFLSGPQAAALLAAQGLSPPPERLSHAACQLSGSQIWLRNIDLAGPGGYLVACDRKAVDQMRTALIAAGAVPCGEEAFQAARIEFGTPLFGQDISDENLPQEIDRDRWAISFTKGCYLGQETVARIDALGHVNRLLRGIKFSGATVPLPNTELHSTSAEGSSTSHDGKIVGSITSACWSPKLQAPLGLGFIRRDSAAPGTKLQSQFGEAEMVTLPLREK